MMTSWSGGKGSNRRPENNAAFRDNWDAIFNKKEEEIEFNFDYERMKQHVECKTIEIPKGLTREEKMAWLMDYQESLELSEEISATDFSAPTVLKGLKECAFDFERMFAVIEKLNSNPKCTQEWLLEKIKDK